MSLRIVALFSIPIICFGIATTTPPQQKVAASDSLGSGRELYTRHCAGCHGKVGNGDGPAAGALKVHPTDLTTLAKRNGGRFPAGDIYQVIKWGGGIAGHGSKEMPVWGPVFMSETSRNEAEATARIKEVIQYIESLQVK